MPKAVRKLLDLVPREHLVGLDSITVVDDITLRNGRSAAGVYRPKDGRDPARIEIAVNGMHGALRFARLLPFLARFILA